MRKYIIISIVLLIYSRASNTKSSESVRDIFQYDKALQHTQYTVMAHIATQDRDRSIILVRLHDGRLVHINKKPLNLKKLKG